MSVYVDPSEQWLYKKSLSVGTFGVFPSLASRVRSRSWEGGAMKMMKGLRLEDLSTCRD